MTTALRAGASSSEEMYVQAGLVHTRAARVIDGRLADLYIYSSADLNEETLPSLIGGTFVGRVVRAVPGVDAVFVDILPNVTGFLAARHTDGAIHEGARVLVKVIKEAHGDKGPQLSAIGLTAERTALQKNFHQVKPRTRVDTPLVAEAQIVRDHVSKRMTHVWFDTAQSLKRAQDYARVQAPDALPLLHQESKGEAFDAEMIDAQIDAALNPRVPLPCGGWITLESTEGFTAIDVNSGGFNVMDVSDAALEINRQAAMEIARQVRLRSIGGLIVIDFIQMKAKAQRAKLETSLKQALAHDPHPCQVAPLSPFGVIEMTRRRTSPSLESMLTDPAAAAGRVLSFAHITDRLVRALEREAATAPGLPIEIRLSAALGSWLRARPTLLQALEARTAARVALHTRADWARPRFDVHVLR